MTGIRTNQIADDAVTAAKIAELTSKIQYSTLIAEGAFSDNKDIVSKKYVDDQILANIEGLDVKQSARACSTTNLQGGFTGAGVGAYLESFDPNYAELTIDGVALDEGDSVLVKDEGGAIFDTAPWPAMGVDYQFTDTTEFGKYFQLVAPDLSDYYVWLDDGSVGDPSGAPTPANQPTAATGIAADVSAAVSGIDVATAIKTAVDAAAIAGLTVVRYDARLWFVWATESSGNDQSSLDDGNGAGSVVSAPLSVALATTIAGDPDASLGRRNGIYIYRDTATATRPWRLTRRIDFDENADVTANAFLWISEGSSCADTGWVLISDDPLVVDTDGLAFAQFNGAGSITAGDALQKTGNTLDVLYDNFTVGINGSNQLKVNEGGIKGEHLANSAFNGGFVGGLTLHDGVVQTTYGNATNPKPQFAASIALDATPAPAFVHGETLAFSGGGTGIFMAFDSGNNLMYYLPTNATVPLAAETITGGIAGLGDVHATTPNDQRGNTPNGATTTFDLSIATYNAQEAPVTPAAVQDGSAEVSRNGVLQKPVFDSGLLQGGTDVVFVDSIAATVEFSTAPAYGEEIQVRYIPIELGGV